MTVADLDLPKLIRAAEDLYLERKSLFEGEPGKKRPRNKKAVREHIAEVVAAFANADGGVLVLGVEDDGTITGHDYSADAVEDFLRVPERVLTPPLRRGERVEVEGHELLVFEAGPTPRPVMVQGNGYPYRVGDTVVRIEADKIQAWKERGLIESWETSRSECTLGDLDAALLERARARSGLRDVDVEKYLRVRHFGAVRGDELVLGRAAELLFTKEPERIEHPNAGVRLFRVIGTERKVGHQHNVEETARIEGNLAVVLEATFTRIAGLLRRPQRLRGLRFKDVPEYPEFAWQEAIINAVAHRDYRQTGACVEVWMYDDRLEVRSPGDLPSGVTLASLRAQQRVHVSRNPRLVHGLVDLGFMREQGEGIPRMFAEMELQFLAPPEIDVTPTGFVVTLRNAPLLRSEDAAWLGALENEALTDAQAKAMALARIRGRVTNADLRVATGLDVLGASAELRGLRDRGLLEARGASVAASWVPGPRAHALAGSASADRGELAADRGELEADRGELAADRGELAADRGELRQGKLFPEEAVGATDLRGALGQRPRSAKLRAAILKLTAERWWRSSELAGALGLADVEKLVARHLGPLCDSGELVRKYPDRLNHPDQQYRAAPTPETPEAK